MKPIETGNPTAITLITLIAIYSLSVVTSLPGLAVSPILGQLETVFSGESQLKIQMLESLPSLIIVPFILIAGKLSMRYDNRKLLIGGLSLFLLSTVIYLLPVGLNVMLINSILLGVGAGIVIPLSTGLIAQLFSGEFRARQLGIVSAIANLSLVGATALAGALAGINWHLSFLVYGFSAVSLVFAWVMRLPQTSTATTTSSTNNNTSKSFAVLGYKTELPIGIMSFYLFITIVALSVPFNLAILMAHYKTASVETVGNLISLFFLSITVPGFFVSKFIRNSRQKNNILLLSTMSLGSIMFVVSPNLWSVVIGIVLVGMSYGLMQPLIYERASSWAAPERVTFTLAVVMIMNYLAIILYPFLQEVVEQVFRTTNPYLSFVATAVLVVGFTVYYIVSNRAHLREFKVK